MLPSTSAPAQCINHTIYWTDPSSFIPRAPLDDTNGDLPNTRPDRISQILVSHSIQFSCINITFLGQTARPKHIYSLYPETASAGYLSFYEMIQAASILYSDDQSKSRAQIAAKASQTLNAELIASDSIAFIDNPMALLITRQKDWHQKRSTLTLSTGHASTTTPVYLACGTWHWVPRRSSTLISRPTQLLQIPDLRWSKFNQWLTR